MLFKYLGNERFMADRELSKKWKREQIIFLFRICLILVLFISFICSFCINDNFDLLILCLGVSLILMLFLPIIVLPIVKPEELIDAYLILFLSYVITVILLISWGRNIIVSENEKSIFLAAVSLMFSSLIPRYISPWMDVIEKDFVKRKNNEKS